MIRYSLLLMVFLIGLNCKESKQNVSDYSDDELYEVQGIIIKLSRTRSPFDNSSNKIMKYIYHLDYEIPLEGVENNYNLVYKEGTPIIVLVSKENPEKSFFSHVGRIDDRLKTQDELINSDTIFNDGVKIFNIESSDSN